MKKDLVALFQQYDKLFSHKWLNFKGDIAYFRQNVIHSKIFYQTLSRLTLLKNIWETRVLNLG